MVIANREAILTQVVPVGGRLGTLVQGRHAGLPLRGYGYSEGESRTLAYFAFHTDLPAVGFDQLPGNGQPQTGPSCCSGSRFVDPIEALEDVGQVLRGNAFSSVPYADLYRSPLNRRRDGDFPAGGRVGQPIAQEIT